MQISIIVLQSALKSKGAMFFPSKHNLLILKQLLKKEECELAWDL